jgi:hypothetical protein
MTTQNTDPLAGLVSRTAAGERLVFVPHPFRELGARIFVGVVGPPLLAASLLLPALIFAACTGWWAVAWVALGLTALAITGLSLAILITTLTESVRWIEFRPHGSTKQLVIAHFLRSSTVAAADLQRVVLIERFRAGGERRSIDVVLHTRGGTLKCEPGMLSPMSQVGVGAEALLDWLTIQFSPAGIAVEHRTEIDRTFLVGETVGELRVGAPAAAADRSTSPG